MVTVHALLLAAAAGDIGHLWNFGEWNDDLTDARVVAARLVGSRDTLKAYIHIRCTGGKLEAYVAMADYIGTTPRPVRYRIDDGKVQGGEWSTSTDGMAVFATKPRAFAEAVSKGKVLIFEARDYQGTPTRQTFDLGLAEPVVAKVLDACPAKRAAK